ncbi:ankyrin [Penicillium macrosclerotiorum]|uniref:ankyrin n=1 Tax=Penicillium macrosclerotiorum TaxID=303699 RepID=UPI002549510E|nr:ankyrin [Penicillium macrosclerotiorum]KAJ5693159.1 ankyrin [Penicillium macrosclerotiorum]
MGRRLYDLPNEVLGLVMDYLEYASEVHALGQICAHLHAVVDAYLYAHYAREYSPRGLDRIIQNNNLAALRRLLAAGIGFHRYYCDTGHATPLPLAAKIGRAEVVRLLLEYDGVRFVADDLDRALLVAAAKNYVDVLRVLVSSGMKPFALNKALRTAAEMGSLASVRYLIEDVGVEVDSLDYNKTHSPLMYAAGRGDLEMVQFLVQAGANLMLPCHRGLKGTPLALAARMGYENVARFLVESGAQSDSGNGTLLEDLSELVLYEGNTTILSLSTQLDPYALLESHGPEKPSEFLCLAVAIGDVALVQKAMEIGAPVDWEQGWQLFYTAAMLDQKAAANYLLEELMKKSDLESRCDWIGLIESSLMLGNKLLLSLLLDHEPSGRLAAMSNSWKTTKLLETAEERSQLLNILVARLGLDNIETVDEFTRLAIGAYSRDDYALAERVLEQSRLGPLDTLVVPDTALNGLSQRSILQIAAHYSSFECFERLVQRVTLDPANPLCRAALASAAVSAKAETVKYFLDRGFDVNALYEDVESNDAAEALPLIVLAAGSHPDRHTELWAYENAAVATINLLLDYGAEIDKTGLGQNTALATAVKAKRLNRARILFNAGANPLAGVETGHSALEVGIKTALGYEKFKLDLPDFGILELVEAFVNVAAAQRHRCEDILRLTHSLGEGLLPRKPHMDGLVGVAAESLHNTAASIGPAHDDPERISWARFFIIKALRRYHWRLKHLYPGA